MEVNNQIKEWQDVFKMKEMKRDRDTNEEKENSLIDKVHELEKRQRKRENEYNEEVRKLKEEIGKLQDMNERMKKRLEERHRDYDYEDDSDDEEEKSVGYFSNLLQGLLDQERNGYESVIDLCDSDDDEF